MHFSRILHLVALTVALLVPSLAQAQQPNPLVLTISGFDLAATLENGFGARGGTDYLNDVLRKEWDFAADAYSANWSGDVDETATWVAQTKLLLGSLVRQSKRNGRPVVVVAHSWGSVIAYRALSELASNGQLAEGDVAALVTLGSPIGHRPAMLSLISALKLNLPKPIELASAAVDKVQSATISKATAKHLGWAGVQAFAGKVSHWRNYWIAEDAVGGPINGLAAGNVELALASGDDCAAHSAYFLDCADTDGQSIVVGIGSDILGLLDGSESSELTPVETAEISPPVEPEVEIVDVDATAVVGQQCQRGSAKGVWMSAGSECLVCLSPSDAEDVQWSGSCADNRASGRGTLLFRKGGVPVWENTYSSRTGLAMTEGYWDVDVGSDAIEKFHFCTKKECKTQMTSCRMVEESAFARPTPSIAEAWIRPSIALHVREVFDAVANQARILAQADCPTWAIRGGDTVTVQLIQRYGSRGRFRLIDCAVNLVTEKVDCGTKRSVFETGHLNEMEERADSARRARDRAERSRREAAQKAERERQQDARNARVAAAESAFLQGLENQFADPVSEVPNVVDLVAYDRGRFIAQFSEGRRFNLNYREPGFEDGRITVHNSRGPSSTSRPDGSYWSNWREKTRTVWPLMSVYCVFEAADIANLREGETYAVFGKLQSLGNSQIVFDCKP